jgi:alanyl-tRNA synthetase
MLTGSEIRRKFLDFFVQKGHREVHSSSLVPANDPTLLFTNAGMNQFKDVFLGLEKRDYRRATSSQKCVRAGGKHNDLENVGFTNRHHTFFEMLGNFSFGDYFKRDAIAFAWELITSPQWFGLSKDKLYVTIFSGEGGIPRDDEAHGYWREQDVAEERIHAMGLKDNFWQMGDTGPCGPCSEIHYDMGPAASEQGHTDCQFPCDCGRYVEIWNLVFMQFDRDAGGTLNPLPKPSIDTGMGLERVAAVLQGVTSNYDTDFFLPLIQRAAELTGSRRDRVGADALVRPGEQGSRAPSGETAQPGAAGPTTVAGHGAASLRVIADHARATTFLISDGVLPSNEGRGYVLRKIIRRAIRHGRLLGQKQPFFSQMVYAVRDLMKDAYPELNESAERVAKVIEAEERRFAHTLDIGLKRLEDDLAPLITAKQASPSARATYSGAKAFKLYDTFGLPLDFIIDAARDQGIAFDQVGFDEAMSEQRTRAQASWKGGAKATASPAYQSLAPTVFEGYRQTESSGCEVLAIIKGGQGAQELKREEEGEIILDHTPFYADSGGQVGDRGLFYDDNRNIVIAVVT